MKKDLAAKKKSILFGLIVSVSFFLITCILLRIKDGTEFLFNNYLYIGLPIWTFLMYYSAHGYAKSYLTRKNLPIDFYKKDSRVAKIEWGREKTRSLYSSLKTSFYLFGAAVPACFFAYFDESVGLKNSIFLSVLFIFIFISSVSLTACIYLKKRYKFIF